MVFYYRPLHHCMCNSDSGDIFFQLVLWLRYNNIIIRWLFHSILCFICFNVLIDTLNTSNKIYNRNRLMLLSSRLFLLKKKNILPHLLFSWMAFSLLPCQEFMEFYLIMNNHQRYILIYISRHSWVSRLAC